MGLLDFLRRQPVEVEQDEQVVELPVRLVRPPVTSADLPDYAELASGGRIPVVNVDSSGMYAAWLLELQAYYSYEENIPSEWIVQGQVKPEWAECLLELDQPTAYWLEVAYQCMKLELQIAMRTFKFEIHIHDASKRWNQKNFEQGRGVHMAAGGVRGSHEAREHFMRLRGAMPV